MSASAEIENYPGELAMLRGLVGALRVLAQHGGIDEVRRVLSEHAIDEQAATATPRIDGRLAMLLDAIRTHQGRWTTRRVQRLYSTPGINAPQRGAARRDLHALHAMGHLTLCGPENGRYYLLARKDGRA